MINIPMIHQDILLSEYAPEFGDERICVWVNPPRALLLEWSSLVETLRLDSAQPNLQNQPPDLVDLEKQMRVVLSRLWRDWTPEMIDKLRISAVETDPKLLGWMIGKTFALITEHRAGVKKK